MNDSAEARRALDARILALPSIEALDPPEGGWLRAVRLCLGMTTGQFAERYGRPQSRICALERAEQTGAVSLKTLAEAASALDCDFMYAVAPRRPLDEIVRERAILAARKQLHAEGRVERLILGRVPLEGPEEIEERVQQILSGKISRIWLNV